MRYWDTDQGLNVKKSIENFRMENKKREREMSITLNTSLGSSRQRGGGFWSYNWLAKLRGSFV